MDKRKVTGLASQTSWSFAHMAHIYARLGEGEAAADCLGHIVRSCTQGNLLICHNDWRAMGLTMGKLATAGKFQIDAGMGFASAVQEMLLSSTAGSVTILPALPRRWRRGSVRGCRTRCGVIVDLWWDRDKGAAHALLRTRGKVSCRVIPGSSLAGKARSITLTQTERTRP